MTRRPRKRTRGTRARKRTTDGADGSLVLADVARVLREPSRRPASASLAEVARDISGAPRPTMDVVTQARAVQLELIAGRGHYERVIGAIRNAHTSVWIATANAKELLVENRQRYVSILAILDDLAERGVELRLLHAELPSRPFREHIAGFPRLVAGGLALRRCPRVHLKTVIVDGALLYLGSANWTGAGLGAKGSGRRNFELGIVTDDAPLLDRVQAMYEHLWSGGECAGCRLRAECPGPLADL